MNPQKKFHAHPNALVETDQVGESTHIWAFAHVLKGAVVGSNCNIGDGTFVEGGARIGNNVTIKNICLIWDGVEIADDAFIGPNVVFTNDLWPRSPRQKLFIKRQVDKTWLVPTKVGRGASLGASVTVVCGTKIGEYAMVGTGSVVTKDIPAFSLAYGVPAKVVGYVCRCGLKLEFKKNESICSTCGDRYENKDGSVNRIEA
jgi:acetyltransferase-like isoleucine patch superfamily enzyme